MQILVSEVGYAANDFWAESIEDFVDVPRRTRLWAIGGAAVRIAVVMLIANIGNGRVPFLGVWLLAFLLVLILHNVHSREWRVGTYGLNYQLRMGLLPLALLAQGSSPWNAAGAAWVALAPVAFAFQAKYAADRTGTERVRRSDLGQVAGHALVLTGALFVVTAFAGAELPNLESGPIQMLAAWLLVVTILLSITFFWKQISRERSELGVLRHAHTRFSHDSDIPLGKYRRLLNKTEIQRIYLSDHAEDIDQELWMELKEATNGSPLVAGLEYEFRDQHLLLLGIANKVHEKELTRRGLSRMSCEEVIWAHPRIAMRRLWKPTYLFQLFRVLTVVDSIEFRNEKEGRAGHLALRHLAVAFVGFVVFGRVPRRGWDFHRVEDLHRFSESARCRS